MLRTPFGVKSNNIPLVIPIQEDNNITVFEGKCGDGSCFDIKFDYTTYKSSLYQNDKIIYKM